jgi:hypothetical protein
MALTAGFFVCCSALLAGAAPDSEKPGPDQIRSLITQLDDDDFDRREAAMEKLVVIGEQALPLLKTALENKGLSPEAENRIRHLLGSLSAPAHGVVWRVLISPGMHHNEKAQVPEGILAGDVITEINGEPINSDEASSRFRGHPFKNARATIWRGGKILSLTLTMNAETTLCFHPWPDATRLYEQYGHRGEWDKTVLQALAIGTLFSNSQCEPLYQKAYDAGCRDALVVFYWAAHLLKLGKLEEAEKIVLAARQEKLHGSPGGRYLYSELPILHARILRHQGKFDEADKTIATALTEAEKNGAFEATQSLKYQLFRNVRYVDKPDPLAYLQRNASFPYDSLAPRDVASWCQIVSREGDPSGAVELLRYLKPKLKNRNQEQLGQLEELDKYYASQVTRAKAYHVTPEAKRKPVAVLYDTGFWSANVQAGRYTVMPNMPEVRVPGAIGVNMRICEFPKNYGAWVPVFRFGCASPIPTAPMELCLSFDHDGNYIFYHRVKDQLTYPETLCKAMDWGDTFGDKHVFFSIREGVTQMSVNGKAFRTWYYEGKLPEKLQTFIFLSSARAWFYNFMYYAFTDADVDAEAISKAWYAWHAAAQEGDGKKLEDTADGLLALMKPVPEAKRGVAFVEAVQRGYRAAHQPDGWCPDPRLVLADPETDTGGLWEPAGDWMAGMVHPDRSTGTSLYCQIPVVLPESFEVTGQVAAEGHMCPAITFSILWNNNLKRYGTNSPPSRPSLDVPWTQVPSDKLIPAEKQAYQRFVDRLKKERTFSFLLRKIGPKAALYVNGLEKPLLLEEFKKRIATGKYLGFYQHCPHGLLMLRGIKVRAVDPRMDIDAPVQFPEMKPVPTQAELKNLYDRLKKMEAEPGTEK